MTTGVVLMTYGAPAGAADLPRYLTAVRGGRDPGEELIAEMRRRYDSIGGSPLVAITERQAAALERELGPAYRVVAGMRYSEPTIARAATTLRAAGVDRVAGVCLSPQWSDVLMGGYERALRDALAQRPGVTVGVAHAWYREPLFIDAVAMRVHEALEEVGPEAERIAVVLTAHSLPRRVFEGEPGYVAQLRETADLVAARAGLPPGRWHWAYQSAGHTAEEWLRPDLTELFPSLAAAGHRAVLVVPVQFLADHLEVLYDLDIAAASQARSAGLTYRRIAMPGLLPTFIAALAAIATGLARDMEGVASRARHYGSRGRCRMEVKELGHLVLYVSDLERSRRFYGEVLGWKEITPEEGLPFPAAAFSSGRTHHELLLIEVGPQAAPIPRGRRLGLYHFGLKVGESDDELRAARDRLAAAGTRIVGATDHGVTHSLYIEDPDGNEIELYIDVQPAIWKEDPAAIFTAGNRPLRL